MSTGLLLIRASSTCVNPVDVGNGGNDLYHIVNRLKFAPCFLILYVSRNFILELVYLYYAINLIYVYLTRNLLSWKTWSL